MVDGEKHGEVARDTARLAFQLTRRCDPVLLPRLRNTTERVAMWRSEEVRG